MKVIVEIVMSVALLGLWAGAIEATAESTAAPAKASVFQAPRLLAAAASAPQPVR